MKIHKENYFEKLTGFKITDSHFELGSNLHINDYYYAKRVFYNSFYANRLAFLTARYILDQFKDLIINNVNNRKEFENSNEGALTLLGFDNHSELLISNLRKMLNDYCRSSFEGVDFDVFNHEVFTKDSLFLKNPDKIGQNIISIFPISTTFSTTVKVRSEVKILLEADYQKEGLIFHDPIINLILIAQDDFKSEKTYKDTDIEREYGWTKFNLENKIIEVESIDDNSKIQEKFFINLASRWEKINECRSCYPTTKNNDEKCLIETKTNPATPDLIFSFPKTFIYNDFNLYEFTKSESDNPIVYRKHFKKHNNNFLYYIKTGLFLKKNKNLIIDWIKNVGSEINFPSDCNIVIVTPSHDSNAGFVNLVNEYIFSDTATIVQYNPSEDYLYNFKKFYSEIIEVADLVIFVDDILFSTNTFNDINFYIKSIERKGKKGIDLCINLINRSGFYNYCKLIENLKQDDSNKKIFSFLDINVSPLLHKRTHPFDKLQKKFEDLSNKAVLDEMRLHFEKRKNEFSYIDLAKDYKNLNYYGSPKSLFQFLIFNELNSIFSYDNQTNVYVHNSFINDWFSRESFNSHQEIEIFLTNRKSISDFLKDNPIFKYEIKNLIYKVFSSEPFIHFKSIKLTVFQWVLNDLVKIVKEINSTTDIAEVFFQAKKNDRPVEFSKYQEFKFLLKRGVKLKMNYVYSMDVLIAIEKVLRGIKKFKKVTKYELQPIHESVNYSNADNLFDSEKHNVVQNINYDLVESDINSKKISTNGFITYYVGLLQELIIEHEAKALQTVINVKRIIISSRYQSLFARSSKNLKNTYNDDFLILLRRMVLENTFIFNTSSAKFIERLHKKLTFDCLNNNNTVEKFFESFESNFDKYSFDYTRKMLASFEISENDKPNAKVEFLPDDDMLNSFKFMLVLKSALCDDLENNSSTTLSVKNKIETILKYCCKILNIENGGAFFSVKYKNRDSEEINEGDFTTVGEYYNNPNNYIKSFDIDKDSIVYNMFKGIKRENGKYPLSCFELSLNNDAKFQYLTNDKITEDNINSFIEVEEKKFDNLFFLKISEINSDNESIEILPKAIICFYENIAKSNSDDFIRFDPKRIRQLLLLRNDISDFINHHLNNDSLRAYIEEQNQFVINKAITHSFETYVEQYKDALQDIQSIEVRDKFDVFGTLILNKHFLLKFVAEYQKTHSLNATFSKLDINKNEKISGKNLKNLFIKNLNVIFSINLTNYDPIDLLYVNLSLDIDDNEEFICYDFFYKELIFEVFYNLRKLYDWCVDENNHLNIVVKIIIIEGENYLSITNNLFDYLPKDTYMIREIKRNMYNNKQKKGLSLINTISEIIYKRNCKINQEGSIFELQIPIKLI